MQVARPALPARLALGLSLTHQRVCVVCASQRSATEPRRDRKRKLFDSPPPPADRSRRRSAITFSARKELVLPPPLHSCVCRVVCRVCCVVCGVCRVARSRGPACLQNDDRDMEAEEEEEGYADEEEESVAGPRKGRGSTTTARSSTRRAPLEVPSSYAASSSGSGAQMTDALPPKLRAKWASSKHHLQPAPATRSTPTREAKVRHHPRVSSPPLLLWGLTNPRAIAAQAGVGHACGVE